MMRPRLSSEHRQYEVTLWPGDCGLPSVDTNSLVVYAYLKCLRQAVSTSYCTNPVLRTIPTLTMQNMRGNHLTSKEDVHDFLDKWYHFRLKRVPDLDSSLTQLEQLESRVYLKYVRHATRPGLWLSLWYDEQNYIEVTRKFYRNSMWFPFNIIYPWLKKTSIISYLKSLVYEENLEEYSYLLLDKAKTSLEVLSCKLGDKNFFYGDSPTTLDVIVFAHLAPLLNAPLPSTQLQASLKEHDNLCKLIRRLSATLFPELKLEYRYVAKLQEEDPEFRSSPGLLVLAILCAASAMISYGMIAGVFRSSRS